MKQAMTIAEVKEVKAFIESRIAFAKPTADKGTCVSGNGIKVEYLPPRCKYSRYTLILNNPWTQCEQEKALNKILKEAKEKFPKLANFMHYDCGNMN